MMSPKRWILLLIFYISYLMFGASIYYHIEHNLEKHRRAENRQERNEINEYLLEQLSAKNESTQNQILQTITDYCGKPVTNYNDDEYEIPYTWTFYHSFFFAFTVCSTVGYGNISPTTTLGRMIMIVYSVIGIPINGILFAGLGEYFGRTFQAIYRRYKKYKMSNDKHYVQPQLGLITTVLIALVPGITLFLLLPSWVFTYFEKWPFSLAFYYSYVTTTTIGFGDYVPTFQPNQPREFGGWFVVYQIFIIVWFIFSLGYLLMLMTFITRGLQSKKLAYLEQQLSTNIKATQNRIWNGVTKDVGYLRKILNELYILKFKPVYTEPDFSLMQHRSISCPELSMYRVDPPPAYSRKRAFSECYDAFEARAATEGTPRVLSVSDTELDKFDRQKSFETADAFRQTTGLLAKVVSALATVKTPEEDMTVGSAGMYGGYHGFSDSQILESEWSFTSATGPPQPRGRARSDFNITPDWQQRRPNVQHNEWTWSGDNNQIQQAINNRYRQRDRENLYRASFGQPPLDYIVHMEEDEELSKPQAQRVKKFSVPDGLRKLFPFKKQPGSQEFNTPTTNGDAKHKFSVVSVPDRAPPLDYYSTVTANASPSYFRSPSNAKIPVPTNLYDSDASISSRLSSVALGGGNKKRRESIFAQNPALSARRGSMFPPSSAAALSQRRGSLFNPERRGSAASTTANVLPPPRRGSLFPTANTTRAERRPSLFAATEEEDLAVLENTTLADLIRALEVMHTQAVMEDTAGSSNDGGSGGGLFRSDKNKKKQRKMGNAGIDLPQLPPILSLFAGDNTKTLNATAANRLYARRSTIVGTLPSQNTWQTSTTNTQAAMPTTSNVRRRLSSVQVVEPPPSYSEKATKFKRRFSIRPTALQIPPGKAPPPGVNINSVLQTTSATPGASSNVASQSSLQRRLELRPSRDAGLPPYASAPTNDVGTISAGSVTASSITRLLPFPSAAGGGISPRPSNTSSSTHSPLSRMVQISEAQRKSSMPEGFALDRNKKPDGK